MVGEGMGELRKDMVRLQKGIYFLLMVEKYQFKVTDF